MTASASVSRIALLASDVLVHASFPSIAQSSASTPSIPVLSVSAGADPGAAILRNSPRGALSFVADATNLVVTRLLLRVSDLVDLPLVLHLAVQNDLSDVLLLRASVPYFLVSTTAQQAHDQALLASRLARAEKKLVVHAFYANVQDTAAEASDEDVTSILKSERQEQFINGVSEDVESNTFQGYAAAAYAVRSVLQRDLEPLQSHGRSDQHTVIFTLGKSQLTPAEGVSFVEVSLLTPLAPTTLLHAIPESAQRVIVLEHISRWSLKWTPLYIDVVSATQERSLTVHRGGLADTQQDTAAIIERAETGTTLTVPAAPAASSPASHTPHIPKHESSYTKALQHLFGDGLSIVNEPTSANSAVTTTPEYALGRAQAQAERRAELVSAVEELLQSNVLDIDAHSLLTQWSLVKDDVVKSRALAPKIEEKLQSISHPASTRILSQRSHLQAKSSWIIGSDAWSHDIGASGLHHLVASSLNVNLLLVCTQTAERRDAGLYAMNHGSSYVASIAIYSSYAQVLQALGEASAFPGPSVVLAYLPYDGREDAPALELLQATKRAVDAGTWPLYRWDPRREPAIRLDSDAVKNDLQEFLDRQNHLSQLTRAQPQLAAELVESLGARLQEERKRRAKKAYEEMLSRIDAPPLKVLYASDGGAAEKVAKRLAGRARARGLEVTIGTIDSMALESLASEEDVHVAFVTSTAGQGEPPQNGRQFSKALNAASAKGKSDLLKGLKFSVFGMGDSHYWPRPEDAHYYNRPGKDLDARLALLGGERVADLGLGDDQDADGPETGYKLWEPQLWKALGVDAVEIQEAEPEPITNEHIKAASRYLRGTIAQGLEDTTTGALAPSDGQLTKFHGIYQQDDRDIRDARIAAGAEPAYAFMIRVRMPGGVCSPKQWLDMDQIADEHGNGTFKITTRQTFQFHGVIKRHLKPAIQSINRALLDTLAACGDVNRNVTCSAIPSLSKLHAQVYEFAKRVSEHLLPRTTAYHEIWLDKKMVAGDALKDHEPLYGEFYLPRKFKIGIAVPPTNDTDVFTNDVGFIAIVGDDGGLAGFNVTVGGGMGVTHGNKKTYPRTGSLIGFCTPEQGHIVAEKIMLVQRENGNRADRKNARLKYTIDRMGLDIFKGEVEKLLGYSLAPTRPFTFDRNIDDFGWHTGQDGKHHFLMFIENGRVQDEPGKDFKTGLREIAKVHKGTFRLTCNQHIMISDIANGDLDTVKGLLQSYGMDNLSQTGLRLASSACVAFPTCGLAMAESERYLPLLIDKVEAICEENGLRNDSIVMRMTGCPNGCARPYVAEVAFVGKAPGTYLMLLGGGYYGQRLNKIYRETVTEPEILAILQPMIKQYALERLEGERFGDFVIRAGYISATTEGKAWYEGMGGEGQYREDAAITAA